MNWHWAWELNVCWLLCNQVQVCWWTIRLIIRALSDLITLPITSLHTLCGIITPVPSLCCMGTVKVKGHICASQGRFRPCAAEIWQYLWSLSGFITSAHLKKALSKATGLVSFLMILRILINSVNNLNIMYLQKVSVAYANCRAARWCSDQMHRNWCYNEVIQKEAAVQQVRRWLP